MRRVDRGGVRGFDEVLADDVYAYLARIGKVLERVLGFIETAGEAEDEEWGVVIYEIEVGEGGEVCGFACRARASASVQSGLCVHGDRT